MLPRKVSCTYGQGFVGKYNLSASRGGDFPNKPFGLTLHHRRHGMYLCNRIIVGCSQVGVQLNENWCKRMVSGIKERLQPKEKGWRVKRCCSLLAAIPIVAVWFGANGLLYMVSPIYRLNQSKVYKWRIICLVEMVDIVLDVKQQFCCQKRNLEHTIGFSPFSEKSCQWLFGGTKKLFTLRG